MSQHDFDISTSDANTGSTMRTQINTALQALASQSAGITAPGTTYAYMIWVDTSTTPKTVRMRNYANTAWVAIGTLSDAGAFIATNSAQVGGFAPSQTPGANNVPVVSSTGLHLGAVRVEADTATPSSGEGLEISYSSTRARLLSYNRSTAAWKPLLLEASALTFSPSGGAEQTIWHSGNAPRVIHARVTGSNGAVATGSGIGVSHAGVGIYYITYSTAFAQIPTVTVTPRSGGTGAVIVYSETASGCTVAIQNPSATGYLDADFGIHVTGN